MDIQDLLRLVLAAMFAWAAAGKLADPVATHGAFEEFGVPRRLAGNASWVVPVFEVVLVFGLLQDRLARAAGIAAIALLAVFSLATAINLARGRRPACNCFGAGDAAPIGARTLVRNGVLLTLAALMLGGASASAPTGLTSLLGLLTAAALLSGAGAHALTQGRRHTARGRPSDGVEPESLGLPVGAKAPEFALPDLHGAEHSLAAGHGGMPVLLVFIHPACGPCRFLAPTLGRWQRTLADRLVVLPISGGDVESNRREAAEAGIEPMLLQPGHQVAEAYGYVGTPAAVVVTRDGLIASPVVAGEGAITELVATWAPASVTAVAAHGPEATGSRRTLLSRAGGAGGGMLLGWLGFGAAGARAAGCPHGATACGSCCSNLVSDPFNCGSCGNACTPDAVCSSGLCCKAGWVNCNGVCVNLKTNSSSCGACGNACPSGSSCSKGRCCLNGQMTCHGACVDPGSDSQNCGSCGHTCPGGKVCAGGVCTTGTCAPGQVQCPGGTCSDLSTDVANCGSCGTACDPGSSCINGICSGSCPEGNLVCGPTCCPPGDGWDCVDNACVCTNGQICGDSCMLTENDTQNCGGCGNVCPAGAGCEAGKCSCPPGSDLCGNACVATGTDVLNCGGCGNACPPGATCIHDTCVCTPSCSESVITNCNGVCGAECNCLPGQVCIGNVCGTP